LVIYHLYGYCDFHWCLQLLSRELLWSWLSFDIAHGDFDFVIVDLLLVISLQSLV
jgi:hypothetical protein